MPEREIGGPASYLRAARAALGRVVRPDERPVSQEEFGRLCGWTGNMQYRYEAESSAVSEAVLDRVNEVLRAAGIDPAAVTP
jgi:hypothetical protein